MYTVRCCRNTAEQRPSSGVLLTEEKEDGNNDSYDGV